MKMKLFMFCSKLLVIFFLCNTVQSRNFDIPIPCENNQDCWTLSPTAECMGGYCMCMENNVIERCLIPNIARSSIKATGPIGRECKLPLDCKVANSYCNTTMSQCLCQRGFISNTDAIRCLPIVTSLGGECHDNKQCLVNLRNTTCSLSQCVCINGFHRNGNSCYKTVGINEQCKHTEECSQIEHAECNTENKCVCSLDTVLSSDKKNCLPLGRELAAICDESVQCQEMLGPYSYCVNNHCSCNSTSHFVRQTKKCEVTRNVKESCKNDYECYQGEGMELAMQCMNDICTCSKGYIEAYDKCVSSAATLIISQMLMALLTLLVFNYKFF